MVFCFTTRDRSEASKPDGCHVTKDVTQGWVGLPKRMRMRAFSSMHAAGEQAAAARAGEMVKVLLALGLWFLTVGCQQCQALAFPGHSRQYTVRLEGNDLVIGISCCSTLCKVRQSTRVYNV